MNRAIFIRDSKDKHVFKVIKTIGYSWSKFRPSNPIEKLLMYRYPGPTEGRIHDSLDSRTRSGEGSG